MSCFNLTEKEMILHRSICRVQAIIWILIFFKLKICRQYCTFKTIFWWQHWQRSASVPNQTYLETEYLMVKCNSPVHFLLSWAIASGNQSTVSFWWSITVYWFLSAHAQIIKIFERIQTAEFLSPFWLGEHYMSIYAQFTDVDHVIINDEF